MRNLIAPIMASFGAALLTVGLVHSHSVHAQDAPPAAPGAMDVSRVSAGTYAVEPLHTLVGWRINHLGFNDYFGIFGDVSGTLILDPENPEAAELDVSIAVSNITVANQDLKNHLLRPGKDGGKPDFFGPEPEPARYVSTAVTVAENGKEARVDGDLTLNGVTKPVALRVRFTGAGPSPMGGVETVGFEGGASIKRSDFNLGFGVPMVGDEVTLILTAAFEKAPAE